MRCFMRTLADVTEKELLHAHQTVADEIKQRTQPIIDELRKFSFDEETAPQQMDLMYLGLVQLLEPEVGAARKEIEVQHQRSLVGFFSYLGVLTSKPISDQEALDYVLDNKLRGLEQSTERLRIITQQRRELYESRCTLYAAVQEKRDRYFERVEDARETLEDVRGQIEAHQRECVVYKARADDYEDATQRLHNASKKTLRVLKEQERALDVEVVKAEPLTERFDQEVSLATTLAGRAQRHYKHFHEQWCKTQYARDMFREIVGDKQERTSLLAAYQTLAYATQQAKRAAKVIAHCDAFGRAHE
jgi:hypothetical protein